MDMAEIKKTIWSMKEDIQSKFPDVKLVMRYQLFKPVGELWVHVLSKEHFDRVKAYCKQLDEAQNEKAYPIWVFAEDSSEERPDPYPPEFYKKRRDEFLARFGKTPETWPPKEWRERVLSNRSN